MRLLLPASSVTIFVNLLSADGNVPVKMLPVNAKLKIFVDNEDNEEGMVPDSSFPEKSRSPATSADSGIYGIVP